MDLCTVISEKFIPQAINLIYSYKINSFDQRVYLYYFNTDPQKLEIFHKMFPGQVVLQEVQPICDHALMPRVFFYKVYAINDCLLNHSNAMIYSDSANCFINKTTELENDLVDGSLFMPYTNVRLANQYWTTKRCFEKIGAPDAELMPQYWAGFQAYKKTSDNIEFVTRFLEYMKDPEVAMPETTVKKPDGEKERCIEHRCDQSLLSILIHKLGRHQHFDIHKNERYGDWQTIISFDASYVPNFENMVLSPRESKFGQYRFAQGGS